MSYNCIKDGIAIEECYSNLFFHVLEFGEGLSLTVVVVKSKLSDFDYCSPSS